MLHFDFQPESALLAVRDACRTEQLKDYSDAMRTAIIEYVLKVECDDVPLII